MAEIGIRCPNCRRAPGSVVMEQSDRQRVVRTEPVSEPLTHGAIVRTRKCNYCGERYRTIERLAEDAGEIETPIPGVDYDAPAPKYESLQEFNSPEDVRKAAELAAEQRRRAIREGAK